MGSNVLIEQIDGTPIIADTAINQIKSALIEDIYARSSDGIPTDNSGSLGTPSLEWLEAFVASGFWNLGDIKSHHTYNGLVTVGQGWYPCDGSIINETNYDLIHGANSWADYIGTSSFNGKYSPDLIQRFIIGVESTSQDGGSVITSVGNSSHETDLAHLHLVDEHTHNLYWKTGSSTDIGIHTYTLGQPNDYVYNSAGDAVSVNSIDDPHLEYLYARGEQPLVASSMSSSQSTQPETIEAIYYLRII